MINGEYYVYKNGILVGTAPNTITDKGRTLILRYLAGSTGTFAGAIAAGSHTAAPTRTDTKLGFEFARGAVTLGAADVPANQIIFKASLPNDTAGVFHEMGLYPFLRQTDTEYAGQVFIGFDSTLEQLSGGTANTSNYRIGNSSYEANAAANGTTTITASSTRGNFGGYSGTDSFSLAYHINDAFTSSISVRLRVDSANYFQYIIVPETTVGYKVTDWPKSSFTVTGNPVWDNISSAEFIVTAASGGATRVQFDGLRVNDTDVYADYGLVSRALLSTPIVKLAGEQMDIEYILEVTI